MPKVTQLVSEESGFEHRSVLSLGAQRLGSLPCAQWRKGRSGVRQEWDLGVTGGSQAPPQSSWWAWGLTVLTPTGGTYQAADEG